MDKKDVYTCIVCPEGCAIRVKWDESGGVASVSGNKCGRGETYVRQEARSPMRNISSTVALAGGGVLPVKTSAPVPRDSIGGIMREVNAARAVRPVRPGQVIVKNAAGTGADIVATAGAL